MVEQIERQQKDRPQPQPQPQQALLDDDCSTTAFTPQHAAELAQQLRAWAPCILQQQQSVEDRIAAQVFLESNVRRLRSLAQAAAGAAACIFSQAID